VRAWAPFSARSNGRLRRPSAPRERQHPRLHEPILRRRVSSSSAMEAASRVANRSASRASIGRRSRTGEASAARRPSQQLPRSRRPGRRWHPQAPAPLPRCRARPRLWPARARGRARAATRGDPVHEPLVEGIHELLLAALFVGFVSPRRAHALQASGAMLLHAHPKAVEQLRQARAAEMTPIEPTIDDGARRSDVRPWRRGRSPRRRFAYMCHQRLLLGQSLEGQVQVIGRGGGAARESMSSTTAGTLLRRPSCLTISTQSRTALRRRSSRTGG